MELNSERITELTLKYVKGNLSAGERAELDAWLSDPDNREGFEERVKVEKMLEGVMRWSMTEDGVRDMEWSPAPEAFVAKIIPLAEPPVRDRRRGRWAAAAATMLILGGSVVLWKEFNNKDSGIVKVASAPTALPPGANKAVLILADKREITLDNAGKGNIATQGNTEVTKTDSALLSYSIQSLNHKPDGNLGGVAFNTLVTPRGGQYKLRLADGTTVYLNAQSSLRFPVAFDGKERRVELQGEGYFEVAHDAARPFKVDMGGGRQVTVLGTRFDVRDYTDDPGASATLLDGSVRVTNGGRSAVLAVDEQATLDPGGALSVAGDEEAEASIAWTKGLFRFSNTDLREVMRQMSRWYDVDVVFEGTVPAVPITASISRNTSAWEVLNALKDIAGLKYRVEGKKIIVMR